jgi:hypothetical protein
MFGSTFDFRIAKIERWKKLNYISTDYHLNINYKYIYQLNKNALLFQMPKYVLHQHLSRRC